MTPEVRTQLIPMLQAAHSGELAAYFAYRGHSASVKDPIIKKKIEQITKEELNHIWQIRTILQNLNAQVNENRDDIFSMIGRFAGWLCHKVGKYLPNLGAQWIEAIGKNEYRKMATIAKGTEWEDIFNQMAKVEEEHEAYFKGLTNENKNS